MIQCLILVIIKNADLFAKYVNGHLPTIAKFGGRVVFRSTENSSMLGADKWDVVVIQEWPSEAAFDLWWNSDDYKAWADIRDKGADMTILKCKNMM
jgi:uncharacterized protein (DUF1330 family)